MVKEEDKLSLNLAQTYWINVEFFNDKFGLCQIFKLTGAKNGKIWFQLLINMLYMKGFQL